MAEGDYYTVSQAARVLKVTLGAYGRCSLARNWSENRTTTDAGAYRPTPYMTAPALTGRYHRELRE
jgi:hypothetical protein